MLTEEQKAEKKRIYEYYKAHGICVSCHIRDAFNGRVLCEYCLERMARNSARDYQKNRAKYIAKSEKRKEQNLAQGLCVNCGKPVCAETKYLCSECRLKNNRKARERWRRRMASDKAKDYRWLNGKWIKRKTPEERLEIMRRCAKKMLEHPNTFKVREIRRKTMYRGIYHGPEWKPRENENEV